jgi:hypothetical protein
MKTQQLLSCFLLFVLSSFYHQSTFGQQLTGKVVDNKNSTPLAFATIVYNSANQGVSTTMDGDFKISDVSKIEFLKISYLGYQQQIIKKTDIQGDFIKIKMKTVEVQIGEVEVFPTENPAHRIIKMVLRNRNRNNPEKMQSFSYIGYNKMVFTIDREELKESRLKARARKDSIKLAKTDSMLKAGITIQEILRRDSVAAFKKDSIIKVHQAKIDSINKKNNKGGGRNYKSLEDFMNHQDLFLIETVSQRDYKYPDKNDEQVLATRVSGLQDPSFVMLATQMQSFSFYNDFISISDKSYLNPISTAPFSKYFFLIEDTTYTASKDTVFIISFRPRKGKTFDALKGVLQINTNGYAIQNVRAEPANKSDQLQMKVQQQYEMIDGKQWFPVQLNTEMKMNFVQVGDKDGNIAPVGIGRTYLKDIKLNPLFNKKFTNVEVKVSDDAFKRDTSFWNKYRVGTLDHRDTTTYFVMDSMGKANNIDLKMKVAETILNGYIPWKCFNLDYTKLLDYNKFEGIRLGFGAQTNNKISKYFSIGGYAAYGFKDKAWKYGGNMDIHPFKSKETALGLNYTSDVAEYGGTNFYNSHNFQSMEYMRNLLIDRKYSYKKMETSLKFRALRYFETKAFVNYQEIKSRNYQSPQISPETAIQTENFKVFETGLAFRFAFKEKFMQVRDAKFSLGTNYPVLFGNITKAWNNQYGDADYTKLELALSKQLTTRKLGKISLTTKAGISDGNIPAPLLYNGSGSYEKFSIDVPGYFATMRMNEFYSSRFASLFYQHNLGRLSNNKRFHPSLVIAGAAGYGWLSDKQKTNCPQYKDFSKGYFESGILLDELYSQFGIFNYGIGVYYRLGEYKLAKEMDNVAVRMTFKVKF